MDIKRYFQTAPKTDLIVVGTCAVLFAMSAVVAAWTPEDILTRPWARAYVDFIARLIPAVERVPKFSPLPGVAQLYFAVMWLTVPVVFGICIYAGVKAPEHRRNEALRKIRGKLGWIGLVVFIPIILYYGFHLQFLGNPPGPRQLRFQMSSRFGLGFIGAFEFCGMPMLAAFWFMLIRNWRRFF